MSELEATAPSVKLEQHPTAIHAAKAWARVHGWTGRKGGWIYTDDGRPVCQGWASLAGRLTRQGLIRDMDDRRMSTRSDDVRDGRPLRNIFDDQPVMLDTRRHR